MQNCIHGAKKFRMCGMEVGKLYEKYFPVNRIRQYGNFNTNICFSSEKQFKIKNYLGNWK
jgi:hypothetical protein